MRQLSRLVRATLIVCLLGLLQDAAGSAAGSILYVKKSGDDTAACTAADPCQTIEHAVDVADPGDTIQVGPGLYFEDDGITIEKDLTIDGGWFMATRVTLDTFSPRQVFFVVPGVAVKLKGMTILGASLGGIYNGGNLTLENVWIRDNFGQGGVLNDLGGSLSMTNVGIDNNAGGAGLINHGTALVVDSHIVGTDHQGSLRGSGVSNTGTLVMGRGLIAGNEGAGLVQLAFPSVCSAASFLLNVTISGNSDRGVDAVCGLMTLRHVTIAANTADTGAGGLQIGSIIPILQNSILATNSGEQCGFFEFNASVSVSHSLIGDQSCQLFPGSGNLIGVDPELKALAHRAGENLIAKLFHIGANRAHALKLGSPAIDGGLSELCTGPFGGSITDQFGVPRPVDGDGDGVARCDMGAVEYKPAQTQTER